MKDRLRKYHNRMMMGIFIVATLLALIPLFGVLGYVIKNGLSVLNLEFFMHIPKALGASGGGMANSIVGTLIMVLIASLIGIPVGILTAIYLTEYDSTSWFSFVIRFATDVLTGIPSIIVGIVIYTTVVLKMGHFSALAGGLALSIIMIPLIIRSTEEMLKLVSHSIREGGYALGITKGKTILRIVLPTAAKGIITGAMLAVARVSGETAPLLFTALGNQYWSRSLNEPIAALPVQIYQYATSPYKEWQQQAWAGSLVLISMVVLLNLIARLAFRSRSN